VWPEPGHLDEDGIGEKLSELHLGNVEKVYSNTLDRKVWGNVCSSCGAYSGNHFVSEEKFDMIAAHQSRTAPVENGDVKILAEIPIEQRCENCDRLIERVGDYDKCNICYSIGKSITPDRCSVCRAYGEPDTYLEHHTSYKQDETVMVCPSCHGKIHHQDGFRDDLLPEMSRQAAEQQGYI
jgi:Zn finger protein HypA/HybF involved in hydrogenase expression